MAICLVALFGVIPLQPASAGVVFEVDLDRYRLEVRDPAGDSVSFRVATGSPAHPTPRGSFSIASVIRKPAWVPGREARRRGGRATPASWDGPMGVAKMPFRDAFALHAGADEVALGKPMTLGCVQLSNAGMSRLITWLESRAVLARPEERSSGEIVVRFQEPALLRIR